MTTTDYLESLQDDLGRTVTALDLEEGTNFTDIADMAENGDISTGGGVDLSEYFNNTISENRTDRIQWDYLKKLPDLVVANNVTQLSCLFDSSNFKVNGRTSQIKVPKVICGSNVTSMFEMYKSYSSDSALTTIDLSGLNTSNVTTMAYMFENRRGLTSLDFSTFDFSKVETVNSMFASCGSLIELDLSNIHGESFTSIGFGLNGAFSGCTSIQKIDLSNFASQEAIDCRSAFYNCYKLEELDLDKWDLATKAKSGYFAAMFYNCGYQLTDGAVTKVYVKDAAAQNWVLTANNSHPSTWTTDNVIIAGSEADLRNA